MIEYKEITGPDEKARICGGVLRALPDWFGIEESILDYERQVRGLPLYAAYDGDNVAGFVAVKPHTSHAAEVCVMGILQAYHRHGIGRKLIELCENYCVKNRCEYLTVKTVDESAGYQSYAKTRQFYLAMGFKPLEVFPLLWDESNPCLMMIKGTGKKAGRALRKRRVVTAFSARLLRSKSVESTGINISIRRAKPSDADGIVRLLMQIAQLHHEGRPDLFKPGSKKYGQAEFDAMLANESKPVFVAEDNFGNVAGYCICELIEYNGHAVLKDHVTLYIDDLCVDERLRGQRIGEKLNDAVIAYAKQTGVYNIELNAWECNPGAIRFYERCGFKVQRRRMEMLV
jgi:ribosomal protein S18 acetylase RimI-like enzyme